MLTAVILTRNEQENIARCLQSVRFCDEIVIIDDGSTDETLKIAKGLGATILSRPLDGDYAAQRNWALSQVKSHWVLFVDADEVVSAKLAEEIKAAIKKIQYKGYLIPRVDYMWGKKLLHGDTGGTKILRLARRGAGEWQGKVHEIWKVEGSIGSLKHPLFHYPHQNLVEFLDHINHYSSIRAGEFFHSGRRTNILEIILGPVWRFFKLYILRLGFMDSTAGFIHAMIMSFYMFLVSGKLYLLQKGIK